MYVGLLNTGVLLVASNMGNAAPIRLDDNQEIVHEGNPVTNAISNFCSSLICAFVICPALIVGMTFMLGWNEKYSVCQARAIFAGQDQAVKVGCASPSESDGSLVLANCDISRTGLSPLPGPGDFSNSGGIISTGLRVNSQMFLCKETVTDEKQGSTTVRTYTYSAVWSSSPIDSITFKTGTDNFKQNCGVQNPFWPPGVPRVSSQYAPSVLVGPYTSSLVSNIPLNTPVVLNTPSGWTLSGSTYNTQKYRPSGYQGTRQPAIGDVQVTFYGNDWSTTKATLLGKNSGGVLKAWTAPDSWLCSGYTLQDLRMGTISLDDLFAAMREENTGRTWFLRFLGFGLMWLACCQCFRPLEAFADCIPFCGSCLGDMIMAIACVVTCPLASACSLGTIGVVWVAMRPQVGVPLMIFFFLVLGGFIAFRIYVQNKKAKQGEMGSPMAAPVVGYAIGAPINPISATKSCNAPVSEPVAKEFLKALTAEYVHYEENALGNFLDSQTDSDSKILSTFEDDVRAASNRVEAIEAIRKRWNMLESE